MKHMYWKKIGGCLILAGSLLLIGATSMKNRSIMEKKQERLERCREAALQMGRITAGSGWDEMIQVNPELCIRAGHTVLHGTNGKATE